MDGIALGRQVQRGRHARHAAADHEGGVGDGELALLERLEPRGLRDRHADEVLGLFGRLGRRLLVDPGALFADVGELEQVGIQAARLEGSLEQRLVGARRAGGHDHAVEPLVLDRRAIVFCESFAQAKRNSCA